MIMPNHPAPLDAAEFEAECDDPDFPLMGTLQTFFYCLCICALLACAIASTAALTWYGFVMLTQAPAAARPD